MRWGIHEAIGAVLAIPDKLTNSARSCNHEKGTGGVETVGEVAERPQRSRGNGKARGLHLG
jgi:hypothetical protein